MVIPGAFIRKVNSRRSSNNLREAIFSSGSGLLGAMVSKVVQGIENTSLISKPLRRIDFPIVSAAKGISLLMCSGLICERLPMSARSKPSKPIPAIKSIVDS